MENPQTPPFRAVPPPPAPPAPPAAYTPPSPTNDPNIVTPAHDYEHPQIIPPTDADSSLANTIDVTRSDLPPRPRAVIAEATSPYARASRYTGRHAIKNDLVKEDLIEPLKGVARAVAKNMDASLEVPTATSVRQFSAKLLIENREVINSYLALSHGGKVSFTHLIGYALVEALAESPAMNVRYTFDTAGKAAIEHFAHVGFGLAIDVPKPDGTRSLVVPVLQKADTLNFKDFLTAYEELVKKGRAGTLTASDFAGATVTLTNPGTIGTTHSVPRLMQGQGLIIGVGATEYPAEWAGASKELLAQMAIGKVMTLTSTYDHRVIQGAGSGELLRLVALKLTGQDGFYERVFDSLQIPYSPYVWEQDADQQGPRAARIMELIHAYRSRGHLAADTDPLAYKVRRHPDLQISSYGLTVWDLDRSFGVCGFRGRQEMTLREIIQQLRETYTRTLGIEYMHIQDPVQRAWIQERLERPWTKPSLETQRHIMTMLNRAEAFEHFLQTKYIGQKRFSLEGGESLIPLLDRVLWVAAHSNIAEVAIGMAHRGRLNVLANIAGKSYGQIFSEFEGNHDPRTVQGSGDVKYHLGTEGIYSAADGYATKVSLAANPSHLEAVDGVLEGIVRAKHDKLAEPGYPVLPLLIHGDAAFIGQGVVYETLNMSQLKAYRNGGTFHVIVNNQIGFTTSPTSGRSTRYCTDLAKGLQVPIFHVNADDPEMVVRVAKLAFEFRQEFNKDVIVDLICYRRRGHNEGDDPSMTQPVMYDLIGRTPTTREGYTADLVGRGDITAEDATASLQEYNDLLNQILTETRENTGAVVKPASPVETVAGLERPESQRLGQGLVIGWQSPISLEMIERIGDAHLDIPEAFTPHPKMLQLFQKRQQMTRNGNIDWGFGELLAFGSLLMEGTPVRMSGQDARRATFVQRHATLHDYTNGSEWTPLNFLVEEQPSFEIYDSSLSEYAPLAFEYGYSVERPEALVLWEAQFGDFANGAQTVLDEFISSAEQKWAQRSSVTLLLPHGYEGQGPDHSSARIERYLGLCAEDNMWVVQPSTPANHFHLLRTQAYKRPRKPLIVFTPKQLLRLPEAVSQLTDFTSGGFQPVISETDLGVTARAAEIDRVLVVSGRLYYELVKERARLGDTGTAIIRLEQYYPLATTALQAELDKYPHAQVVWVQDEPKNQGAYPFLALNLFPELTRPVQVVSRPAAAAPSAGTMALHKYQAQQLLEAAFRR